MKDSRFSENLLCVTGVLGAGTAELAASLAKELGFEAGLDGPNTNPHLEAFYGDMKRHAMAVALWDLDHRLHLHRGFWARIASGKAKGVVQQHTLWESPMFARMMHEHPDKLLSDDEHRAFLEKFHQTVDRKVFFPQLIIHLDCTPAMAMARLKKHGVLATEGGISEEYLAGLRASYRKLFAEIESAGGRVLRLDWERILPAAEAAKAVRGAVAAQAGKAVRSQ